MNLGEKIKLLRNKKSLTQEELANKCGLSKNGLWNYENNKRQPTIKVLEQIAYALGVTTDNLLKDTKESESVRETLKNVSKIADDYMKTLTKNTIEGLKSLAVYADAVDAYDDFLTNQTEENANIFLDELSLFFKFELYKIKTDHGDGKGK